MFSYNTAMGLSVIKQDALQLISNNKTIEEYYEDFEKTYTRPLRKIV